MAIRLIILEDTFGFAREPKIAISLCTMRHVGNKSSTLVLVCQAKQRACLGAPFRWLGEMCQARQNIRSLRPHRVHLLTRAHLHPGASLKINQHIYAGNSRGLQTRTMINRDDVRRAHQSRQAHRDETDRTGSDDRNRSARRDAGQFQRVQPAPAESTSAPS